jgi:hypothetical protein
MMQQAGLDHREDAVIDYWMQILFSDVNVNKYRVSAHMT